MRKELTHVVEDENRDKGKYFHIEEMSSYDAEAWAIEAAFALMNSGADIEALRDVDLKSISMQQIALIGLEAFSKLNYHTARPLLDRMMDCVQIIPDPSKPIIRRPLADGDIEEVQTRIKLRWEAFNLHTGFSNAGVPSKSTSAANSTRPASPTTRTSKRR